MSHDEKDRILEKIRKIFALAENNPSEEEAQAALERGRALLVKYGLQMSDVDFDEDEDDPLETGHDEVIFEGRKVASWKSQLMIVLTDYFECKVFLRHRRGVPTRAIFYGIAVNVQAAKDGFVSMVNQIEALSKAYKITKQDWYDSPNSDYFGSLKGFARTAKLEYKNGIVSGLWRRFKAVQIEERQLHGESNVTALAIRYEEAADEHLSKVLKVKLYNRPGSRSYGTGDGSHRRAGARDSARVNAHRGSLK